jgi:flavin-dependent thymidylate synthase
MNETGTDMLHYADAAMYESQPMLKEEGARITPRVFLLNATVDPLGTCAADMRMYRGDPVYSLDEITNEQRRWAWEELSKTRLNTPLEGVVVKLMFEAVTRSFTHQLVRQRTGAYYVQESLRFAVKKGIAQEIALPPSIVYEEKGDLMHPTPGREAWSTWDQTLRQIERAYDKLISLGIPAEDARGLLPHCVTTRVIYHTNLRALFDHAGNRLCTQAQFEWRSVFMGIMKAMKDFNGNHYYVPPEQRHEGDPARAYHDDGWQWDIIGTPTPMTFAPICYKTGKCEFMSQLDRGCSIRERVQAFHEHGVPPAMWGDENINWDASMQPIDPAEWMADPTAGVTTETNRPV